MGFALSRTIVYWGFDCAEDSIPFTRSTFSKVFRHFPNFRNTLRNTKKKENHPHHTH